MRHVIIIAGPNGSGKTTTAPFFLNEELGIKHFVNADTIAAGLSAFAPEKVAIQAGRAMLERMDHLANEGENFAFETTLASRSFIPRIINLKKNGYLFHLTFLLLDSADLAISRVAERVKMGGHFVSEEVIRRRYIAGLRNFFSLYAPIANSWQMYDNSSTDRLDPIASKLDNKLFINKQQVWNTLVEKYDETTR